MDTINIESLMAEAPRLYNHACHRLGDHQHAQDIVQETLLTAWRKRDSFDGRSSLSTWVIGIMKFKILDHYRSAGRTPTSRPTESAPGTENWGTDPLDQLFDHRGVWKVDPNYGMELLAASPEESAGRAEVLAWVRHCMERLPERLRILFSLREIDELPVPEAAAAAGVTTGSAAVLLTRARHQLRACLQHYEVTP